MATGRLTKKEAAPLPAGELPEGRVYLALGPMCWGKAKTAAEAVSNAKKEAPGSWTIGSKGFRFLLFDAPENVSVDGMGGLRWTYPEGMLHGTPEAEAFDAREVLRYNID